MSTSGTFKFTCASNPSAASSYIPVTNTSSSFTTLTATVTGSGPYTVSIYFEYTTISSNDGLYFYNVKNYYNGKGDLNITEFGGIPLSKAGNQFASLTTLKSFSTAISGPTILTSTSGYNMFGDCTAMTSTNFTNFNTTNITNMAGMFNNCAALTTLDLSNFNSSVLLYLTPPP